MSSPLFDAVEVLTARRCTDDRGYLHVPLDANQLTGGQSFGEIYVVRSEREGDRRGDHFHRQTCEWFSVVEGRALLQLRDPDTGEQQAISLSADEPRTVRVPAGLAHCLVNEGPGPLVAVAVASRPYDPADVVRHPAGPGAEGWQRG